jgi:hypothetical protein
MKLYWVCTEYKTCPKAKPRMYPPNHWVCIQYSSHNDIKDLYRVSDICICPKLNRHDHTFTLYTFFQMKMIVSIKAKSIIV